MKSIVLSKVCKVHKVRQYYQHIFSLYYTKTAAQDEGEWHRTAKEGTEFFMTRWFATERARAALRHAVVSPNVTGRTKERVAQSKRARAGLLGVCLLGVCFFVLVFCRSLVVLLHSLN